MRSGKELILASKPFAKEIRWKSWVETFITIIAVVISLSITSYSNIPLSLKLIGSVITGLLYVRMFVIYHDYQHHAILQKSNLALFIMRIVGIYLLAPQTIWKRSHDHHHNNNSKLSISGIGSYPTICKKRYLSLTDKERRIYLVNRHPATILLGYFTLFIYWLNVKSFFQSPTKHWDSLYALLFHFIVGSCVWYFFGWQTFTISWFIPFFIAFGLGSYLFYSQHNFPSAKFKQNHDWTYDNAALSSTSFMVLNPVLNWFTGYIGYHHVHHLNSRIPFYRLKETMEKIPELQKVSTTSLHPWEMWKCLRLKLWDEENDKMITLDEFKKSLKISVPKQEKAIA